MYLGNVGTGFTGTTLRDLHSRLTPLHRPAPALDEPVPREHARHATWVEPVVVGEVAYRTLTRSGACATRPGGGYAPTAPPTRSAWNPPDPTVVGPGDDRG